MTKSSHPKKILSLVLCLLIVLTLVPAEAITVAGAYSCVHTHTAECLSCTATEHRHTGECSVQQLACEEEEHAHTNECYELELVCSTAEHTHSADCYDADGNLICEAAEHTHTEECYSKNLICEKAEHSHGEECYQNCQHICGEECGVTADDGIMLTGTLGSTADKLTGDWAYLTKFEIYDDSTTDGVIEGILDGSGPFDTDTDPNSWTYKDRQGNDENDQNGKVRSFDTVTYKLHYATATSGEYDYVKEGWMNYEMVLPYSSSLATFQTSSMTWVGTNMWNAAGLDTLAEQTSGYFVTTETRQGVLCQVLRGKYWLAPNESNPYAIPGEGTLSAVVQVLAMEEGDILQPEFSAWMEHNTTDRAICGAHQRKEIITITAPSTTVTAEVRLDIRVTNAVNDTETLKDINFDTGDTDAPNYGAGTVTGKVETYILAVALDAGDGKGNKGLMAPKSGDSISFDLNLSSSVTPTNGSAISLDSTDYAALLWALGSNDNAMDWYGRTTIKADGATISSGTCANTAFDSYTVGNQACYDGGTWSYTVDSSGVIHVSITGIGVDLTKIPQKHISGATIDSNSEILISTGQMELLQPVVKEDGTHIMEDTSLTGSEMKHGTIQTTVADSNMNYSYVSKNDGKTCTLDNDDQTIKTNDLTQYSFYAEKGSGQYDSYVSWSDYPSNDSFKWFGYDDSSLKNGIYDTTGDRYYLGIGGDPTVRGQSIGAFFGLNHVNAVSGDGGTMVAGKSFLKFDSTAVTPTGYNTFYEGSVSCFNYTVLYAVKTDGSDWADDTEMETTSMLSPTLKYYSSLSDIPAGVKCVGILVEYTPKDASYSTIWGNFQDMFAMVGFTVNATAAEGELYQCTVEHYGWSRDAYEAAGKVVPSLLNTSTIPSESWHWQPDYKKGYIADIDEEGIHPRLMDDTSGYRWGDVMRIITAQSSVTKEVAQQENGTNKVVYYMDSDQRFVDYKIQASTNYLTDEANTPKNITTTLTVIDVLGVGLSYVPDSAYYGGTYVQNSVPGRQGTVTGGTLLTPTRIFRDDYYDRVVVVFEIEVKVGEPIEPIYLTAQIGTRGNETTDVVDGQSISNIVLTACGYESTSMDYSAQNRSEASIRISKNGATSRSKMAENTYIEKGDSFEWTINVGNNGGTSMANTVALDVLPYVGDGQGTTFTGTPTLSRWNIDADTLSNFSESNWKIMYTTDEAVRGTKSSEYNAADIRTGLANGVRFTDVSTLTGASVNWTTGVVTLPEGFMPTAMVMVGTLPGNHTLKISVQIKLTNGEQGDVLVNQLDSYPTPIYVVKRSLEGCTWIDDNKDGIRQSGETMLPGVTATLLKLKNGGDAANEADYEIVKDSSGKDVTVQTGKQKDAVTGVESSYDAGRYCFTNLEAGTYAVRFTNGSTSISAYTASPVDAGTDDTKDSDSSPTYNTSSGKLEKTVILGITMNAANNSMSDINQVSRNNDSGLYIIPRSLTISKTVSGNMGDREKLFDFTITLLDADGNKISGTFGCTSGIIANSDAAAPDYTELVFTDGAATLKLKHGQTVTIEGLPDHCSYTVTESSAAGYTTTTTGDTSVVNLRTDASVAFTNTASVTAPTGILLDIWPYALVVLLALGGGIAFIVSRNRKRKRQSRNREV